jgi:hypothetical protein
VVIGGPTMVITAADQSVLHQEINEDSTPGDGSQPVSPRGGMALLR